jgi:hypothetical protein
MKSHIKETLGFYPLMFYGQRKVVEEHLVSSNKALANTLIEKL